MQKVHLNGRKKLGDRRLTESKCTFYNLNQKFGCDEENRCTLYIYRVP